MEYPSSFRDRRREILLRVRLMLACAARAFVLLAACAVCCPGWAAVSLEEGFRTPPPEARLSCFWWWLNSNVTKQSISRDLEEMKAKGFGGAIIFDAGGADQGGHAKVPAGPMFGGPAWRELYKHALREANRLGLVLSLNIQSGWDLGGPTVGPQEAVKLVTWSSVQVTGPGRFERVLDLPPSKTGYYRDIAVLAYPLKHGRQPGHAPIRMLDLKVSSREFDSSMPDTRPLLADVPGTAGEEDAASPQVAEITGEMDAGGKLSWDVPPGEWEILRFGYAASGARVSTSSDTWQGLVLDPLDRGAFQSYWDRVISPLITDAGPYLGKTLKYLTTDSWELGGVNWTARFRDEFHQRRGYDLLPWLPVITGRIIDSREASNRFLNDFRRTIGDLVVDEHYKVFDELARRYGLGIHPESGGPHGVPIDALRNLGIGAFPQTEFWARAKTHRVSDEERFFVKEAASAAHIYGKILVAAEGMTSIGPQWEESIWDNLKPTFDRALCEGLNLLVWNGVTASPPAMGKPGQEFFAGTHFNPNITCWSQAGAFLTYVNRAQFLAQQGLFIADAIYYYGDQVPNFARLKADDPAHVLPGYDYDVCDPYVLLNRMSVTEGRITLPDGMSYRVLVLPEVDVMSPTALQKITQLVRDGATVIGRRPSHSSTLSGVPQSDAELARLADELWGVAAASPTGEYPFGKGRVIWGRSARGVLATQGIQPDFEFVAAQSGAKLDYLHRRTAEADLYFVSNQGDRSERLQATFRVSGKLPELWLPITGKIRPQALYEATSDGRTALPLRLEPYESVFVVFRRPAGEHFIALARDGKRILPIAANSGLAEWAEVFEGPGGEHVLTASHAGRYELKTGEGRLVTVDAPPESVPLPVTGSWTVHFPPGWGAPPSATFGTLTSWTEHRDPGIKYYSGTATYDKDIEVPAALLSSGKALELDLGEVREIAEVTVNGQSLGVLWSVPRVLDITTAVKPGTNRLQVRVTNLWPNRLIGDQFLPEEKRFTHTNIRKFGKNSPLLLSGLLGPVVLRSSVRLRLAPPR